MGRKPKRRQGSQAGNTTSREKGRIAERIVAGMHDMPGVSVERNVFLPPRGNSGRKREIDVLLTSTLAGYPVQIAIECKNKKKPVGAELIDAFVGKLSHVGIPPQYGIFVSANGYTRGAIARAKEAGIRPLILTGLTEKRLMATVSEAFQSVVYLLLQVVNFTVVNNVPQEADPQQMLVFYDSEGQPCSTAPDLIWQKWIDGDIPADIGEHEIRLDIPPNWHQVINGKIEPTISIHARVCVTGLVITIAGESTQHQLISAADKKIEKLQVNMTFDIPETPLPVLAIKTASELEEFMHKPGALSINFESIRLPRIRSGLVYWPPSERVVRMMTKYKEAFEAGEGPDPRLLDVAELESTELQAIWEPIWSGHPASGKQAKKGN